MRVWLDPQKLTNFNLTPNDVINAISSQNVQAAVGRIGAAPIGNDQQFQLTINTQGRLTTADQFRKIIIRANPDGSFVRVGDVARVELGAKSSDRYSLFNGKPSAAIGIYQSPGANAVAVAERVKKTLEQLKARFPQDVDYQVMYDTTVFVTDTMHEVVKTLIEAFVLVGLVVFLFLGRLRTTIIPLVAVPVAIIGTFAVLLAIGYSANTVSLLALVLAIGIVVDDAIVVIENVERVMEEEPHLSPKQATKKAMGEIVAPIIAITLVLLSVFVPVAFIPGISGQLFRQFAVAVSVVDGDLGDQRADPLAGAVLDPAQARPWPAARPRRLGAHRHRQGRPPATPPSSAGWCASAVFSLVIVALALRGRPAASSRSPPRASCRPRTKVRSSPSCSFPRAPRRTAPARWWQQVNEHHPEGSGGQERAGRRGLRLHQCHRFLEQGLLRRRAQAVRGAAVARSQRRCRDRAPEARVRLDPGCRGGAAQSAAHHRPRQHRRLPVCARGAAGPVLCGYRAGDAQRDRRGQPEASAGWHVLDLLRRHAADLSRHRP